MAQSVTLALKSLSSHSHTRTTVTAYVLGNWMQYLHLHSPFAAFPRLKTPINKPRSPSASRERPSDLLNLFRNGLHSAASLSRCPSSVFRKLSTSYRNPIKQKKIFCTPAGHATCAFSCAGPGGRSGRRPGHTSDTGRAGVLCVCDNDASVHQSEQTSSHIRPSCSGRASHLVGGKIAHSWHMPS